MPEQKPLSFRAYDHVNQKYFYSRDYDSLADFFSYFDNVQFTIELEDKTTVQPEYRESFIVGTKERMVNSLSASELREVLHKLIDQKLSMEQIEFIADLADNINNENMYAEYIQETNPKEHNWFEVNGEVRTDNQMTTKQFSDLLDELKIDFIGSIRYSKTNDKDYE